jgi:uncharacterized Tic20 family protein
MSPVTGISPQGAPPSGAVRVSDAERDRAVEMLQLAYTEGRIDHHELDQRIEAALAARDRADLAQALRGLPLPAMSSDRVAPSTAVAPSGATLTGSERTWAMVAHWSGIATLFVGPAVIAATKGKESAYVREQSYEAINFQLSFLGMIIALGILTAITFGIAGMLFGPLTLVWLLFSGIGGLSAAGGNRFRYPWSFRLLG